MKSFEEYILMVVLLCNSNQWMNAEYVTIQTKALGDYILNLSVIQNQ